MPTVEELGPGDAASVVALWRATGLTRPWNDPDADYRRALQDAASAVLGVREGDALVATAMVGHDGHRGWLYYVAVDPARQRQGLGARLVRAAEAWLERRGGVKLQLMVRAENATAARFYRALGYEEQAVTVLGRRLDASADS